MAGRGPAPKEKSQRRHRGRPARGEWQAIPLLSGRKAPALRKRKSGDGAWSESTRKAWASWWADGAATQWSPADETAVYQLAELYEQVERGKLAIAAEVRQRMDILGLTQKGKRDLRLRIEDDEVEAPVVSEDVPVLAEYRSMIHGG